MSDDVMRQIQDDMREERLKAFWIENRAWIVGGIILAIVMTAALSYWRQHTLNRDAQATYELFNAMDAADEAALKKLAGEGRGTHSALAGFVTAAIHAQKGEGEQAAALYDSIAATRGLESVYRDLATLLAVSHRLDTGDAQKLHAALKPLTGPKSVWRYSALELQALLFARENKMKEAVDTLGVITGSTDVPDEVRARATTLRGLYMQSTGEAGRG